VLQDARLFRYAFTGGVAAVVDVGGFALLVLLRVPIIPAATCSFLAATALNFLLSSHWVFGQRPTLKRYIIFLSGSLFSLIVNVGVTSIFVVYIGIPNTLSKTLAVGATFFLSYWVNARLVFRNSSAVHARPPF
jgi:putative flippase GtrA